MRYSLLCLTAKLLVSHLPLYVSHMWPKVCTLCDVVLNSAVKMCHSQEENGIPCVMSLKNVFLLLKN